MTNYLDQIVTLAQANVLSFFGFNVWTRYILTPEGELVDRSTNIEFKRGTAAPSYGNALAWINRLTAEQSVGLQRLDSPTSWAIITEESGRKHSEYFHGSLEEAFDVILFNVFFDDIEQYFPSAIDGGYKRAVARGQQKILHEIEVLTRPSWLRIDARVDDTIIYNITEEQARAIMLLKVRGKIRHAALCEWPMAEDENLYNVIEVQDNGTLALSLITNFFKINGDITFSIISEGSNKCQ